MSNYIVTTESTTSSYIVALEDDFGFVPLFAVDDFDLALGLVRLCEVEQLCFTNQTEQLLAA